MNNHIHQDYKATDLNKCIPIQIASFRQGASAIFRTISRVPPTSLEMGGAA